MATTHKFVSPDAGYTAEEGERGRSSRGALTACGATQLILGVAGCALGGASFGVNHPANYNIAAGLWGGALCLIAGIISLAGRKSTSRKGLEASMAFSILACVASPFWVWFAANGAGYDYYTFLHTGVMKEERIIMNVLSGILAICCLLASVPAAVASKRVRDEIMEKPIMGY